MKIDLRVLRIGIEVSGEMRTFEGLAMTARGSKFGSETQNTCDIEILNLSKDVRNYILTETSPFNANKTPKRVIVEAGRVSTGTARLFVGEIISSSPTQPPDIGLSIRAQTGAFKKGELVARSMPAKEKLSSIAQKVADDIGATLEFEAADKFISNYSFSGAALRQVGALASAGNVDAFQDDEVLVVKDAGKPRKNRVKVVNASTGMIGVPEATERGVKVTVLYDLETDLGGRLDLTSELNPALDGSYTIYKVGFDLASRAEPWYYTIEASRNE
jgi:hypothetical protein